MPKQDNREWIEFFGAKPVNIKASWNADDWHIAPVEKIPEPFTIIAATYDNIIIDTSHLPDHPFTILWAWVDRLKEADKIEVRRVTQAIYAAELAEAERLREEKEKLTTG